MQPSSNPLPPPTGQEPRERNNELLISVLIVLPRQARQVTGRIEKILDTLSRSYTYYELLLVDNGSPIEVQDHVLSLQQTLPNVRLLRLSRHYSREIAVSAAIDHCIGDYVVIMDLTADPPELIPVMVTKASSGFDAVTGECQGPRPSFLERTFSAPFYRLASHVLGFTLQPEESYFRVFSRRLINSIVKIRSRKRNLSCLNGIVGFQHCSIVYHRESETTRPNAAVRVLKQLSTLTEILVSNSAAPLRLAAMLGFLASVTNVIYLFYILIVSVVKKHIAEGWITTSLTQTTMFLMIFVILSILSEYIARLLDETKEQPLYFIEFETSSSVASPIADRLNLA